MSQDVSFSPAASYLLETLRCLRFFHWNTTSFAAHQALGDIYSYLDSWTDDVTESWMGAFDSFVPPPESYETETYPTPQKLLYELRDWLLLEFPRYVKNSVVFLNKRDELVSRIDKTLYLLRLS